MIGDGDKEEQRINDFGDRERIKRTMTCCLFFYFIFCWITWGRKNSFMLDCLIRGDKDSPQTKIVLGQRYFICQSLLKFEANYFFFPMNDTPEPVGSL